MQLKFVKYCASGNDFIIVDSKDLSRPLSESEIQRLCHRQFGIGADGILILKPHAELDYEMQIFNADGGEASMCANGARALLHYVHLAKNKDSYQFRTKKSIYSGKVSDNHVALKMTEKYDENKYLLDGPYLNKYFVNTGVPHMVYEVANVAEVDVQNLGKKVRYDKKFPEGTNVDFFEILGYQSVKLRVYERGVEGETLSCGTGVIATALACHKLYDWIGEIKFQTAGGELIARLSKDLSEIYYEGNVSRVFEGQISL